jgi:hypothetical protein
VLLVEEPARRLAQVALRDERQVHRPVQVVPVVRQDAQRVRRPVQTQDERRVRRRAQVVAEDEADVEEPAAVAAAERRWR